MNKLEIKKDLDELEKKIEQLKIEYEKFFLGITNVEPYQLKNAVQQLIKKYATKANQFNNVMLLFRYRNLTARFLTYQEYWNRILRLIEEGKNPKDYRRLLSPHLGTQSTFSSKTKDSEKEMEEIENVDKYEKLYNEYASLLKGQGKEPPPLDAFKNTIKKYEENIKKKYGDNVEADFTFENRDGTLKVKTVVKKKR